MSYSPSRPLPLADAPSVILMRPDGPAEIEAARTIFKAYAASLSVDLGFQNFEEELARLPGDYAEPRGALLLALVECDPKASIGPSSHVLELDSGRRAEVAGCCALRPLDGVDYSNAAEIKRLYVRPGFRGMGLGRRLVEAALDAAHGAGYGCVLLDTLDDMESARGLYAEMGFEEVPPYYHNPIAGSHYLKADL
ncbi:GCN5-related N-acetyltransferase [Burkholderiales bacterium 8X]|nr:GCN5-related N-acetyltransferase [Burkholderiales bacterium 8X]